MGSGKKKKAPKAPAIPAAPTPQNSYIYDGDTKVGENVYDKATNSWKTTYYKTPEQTAAEDQYNTIRKQAADDLANPGRMDESLNNWQQAYTNENSKPIKDVAKQARTQAIQNYNVKGVLGSSGMSDYVNRNIDKTEAEGLQSVANEATMNKEQIRQSYLSDIYNRLNAGQTGSSTLYNQGLAAGQFANSTGAQGNSITSQNYNDRINAIMSRFNAQMQSYNAGMAGGGGGMGSSMIGAGAGIAAAALPLLF